MWYVYYGFLLSKIVFLILLIPIKLQHKKLNFIIFINFRFCYFLIEPTCLQTFTPLQHRPHTRCRAPLGVITFNLTLFFH